jgi:hypothetical protein
VLPEGTLQVKVTDDDVPVYAGHPEPLPDHELNEYPVAGLSLMVTPVEPFPVAHSWALVELLVDAEPEGPLTITVPLPLFTYPMTQKVPYEGDVLPIFAVIVPPVKVPER